MFDIGYGELLVIAIVALLVLGPERLPGALRTAGLWIGRLRRSFDRMRADIEQEIGADEIRRQLHNDMMLEQAREIRREIESTAHTLSTGFDAATAPRSRSEAAARAEQTDAPAAQATAESAPTADATAAVPDAAPATGAAAPRS